MANNAPTLDLAQAGRLLGHVCRKLLWWERGLNQSSVQRGASSRIAHALLWMVMLGIIAVLLYVAFWIGLMLMSAVVLTNVIARSSPSDVEPQWNFDNPSDPRGGLFYHPQDHNDDPDPRWHYPER